MGLAILRSAFVGGFSRRQTGESFLCVDWAVGKGDSWRFRNTLSHAWQFDMPVPCLWKSYNYEDGYNSINP